MCGRGRCTLRADDIPRACHRTLPPSRSLHLDRYRPSYNVSPGFNVPVVRRQDSSDNAEAYVLHCMKWGLIPSFTKKTDKPDHYKMFNARAESIDEKASFRRLIPKSRCLVAVEGFYEWKKDGSKKQPYYIHFKDGRPLVFAALYDSWQNSEGETLYTFTIVTTSSSSALQWLHDRMPVILGDKDSTDTWLSGSGSSYKGVLKPYEESDLVWYPVTPAMGKPSFDGPECIKEIQVTAEGNTSISKFFSRKGAESEDKKPEQKISCHEFVKTECTEGQNEEAKTKEEDSEIQVKAEGNTSISKFFSRKGAESEYKKPEQKLSCHEFVKTEHTEDQGEEAKIKEEDSEVKSSSFPDSENATKLPIKRDYEAFSADSKPALATNDQISANPAKKKEKGKTSDNKQPTLFSFFGKR